VIAASSTRAQRPAAHQVGPLVIVEHEGAGPAALPGVASGAAQAAALVLAVQRDGCAVLRQGGREACLAPGDLAVYSNERCQQTWSDGAYRQTLLVFPAQMVRQLSPHIDALTAVRLERDAPAASLLRTMADTLVQIPFDEASEAAATHAANALAQLLAFALAALAPAPETVASVAQAHIARIKQHIASNLHDSNLSVATVSAALKISPAHIHRMFLGEAYSFSEWLWHQRLLGCKAALSCPEQAHHTVSQIAYGGGFNNLSHFSRAFRAKFGISPSACRAQAVTGRKKAARAGSRCGAGVPEEGLRPPPAAAI
jgi:AraC-like DNA-binding protein